MNEINKNTNLNHLSNSKDSNEIIINTDKKNSYLNEINENRPKNKENHISFICIYDIKDDNETQIINNMLKDELNEEIELKIKILNIDKKENLIFTKKFDKIGENIIKFVVEGELNKMNFMFNNCSSLKKIICNSIDTLKVTNISSVFSGCKELEYLDLTNFNTSNVTDMSGMFSGCHKLKEIKGIKNFNTINVLTMKAMFSECYNLESLDLSNFKMTNVIYMTGMFNECYKLKEIKGIDSFYTISVKNMDLLFRGCYEIEYLNLSNFNTSNVVDMEFMFHECCNLKKIKGIKNTILLILKI